jgi:hypothetical protein
MTTLGSPECDAGDRPGRAVGDDLQRLAVVAEKRDAHALRPA